MDATEPLRATLRAGIVIPAHPLALTAERRLDERRQRALTRYYCDAGASGLAVGVHTTQFAIREAGLLRPVLELAARTARGHANPGGRRRILIAGVCGVTTQAVSEAALAQGLGYDAALVTFTALRDAAHGELLEHSRRVADVLPIVGFYLQPAVGGRVLSYEFWRRFLEIERVVAVKVAPFDRYCTIEVLRAAADSGRTDVALLTGNDDHIVCDLLTERIAGGILGQWAVWTRRAVALVSAVQAARRNAVEMPGLLRLGDELTDANSAIFDARNGFAGCIAGVHEILRRQGLLAGRSCLDPSEDLSLGQSEEIDRVLAAYPHLTDDAFVRENLDRWLA